MQFERRSSGTLAHQVLYVQQLRRLPRQSHPACATCIKGERQRQHRELRKASKHSPPLRLCGSTGPGATEVRCSERLAHLGVSCRPVEVTAAGSRVG